MLLPLHLNLQPRNGGGRPPTARAPAKRKGYLVTAKQLSQIKREDEELITLITLIEEYLP